ncbi:tolB protein precursor, periplasmic protein involved in the tonb-independent uptake of group A colicins [hydrothermal vent metagenome]|uniref:TolB protein, periplasmic protein involved in the tonb-independent uptake of group A colicins n=1 Tax=hydrothermal vent metagenome TaxID=652676 RepID=A0A3B0VHD8_9ZZZZ
MSRQTSLINQTKSIRLTRPWQLSLLLLFLISVVAALFITTQKESRINLLPPVLYLAEDETGRLQLFLASEPAWQPRQLTRETAEILSYSSAPDGNQVAYAVAQADGSSQIKLLQLNNSTVKTVLTCANAECSQPVWHPDSRRLLYERRTSPNFARPQLHWLDVVTGETKLLLEKETAVSSSARFSPDGNWVSLAVSPEVGIRLYNFADGRSFTFPSDIGTPAAWHPSGNQLLFQNSRAVVFHSEDTDVHDEHSHDFTMVVNLFGRTLGSESTELLSSNGAFDDGNPAYSPDGKWIAFGRRLARTNTGRQLWLMQADGSESHLLTNDISIHYGPPSWSPDGRLLLFQKYNSSTPDQPPSIWLLEIASGKFSQIIKNGLLPTWLSP